MFKKLFFFISICFGFLLFSQEIIVSEFDSINGGFLSFSMENKVEELLDGKVKSNCSGARNNVIQHIDENGSVVPVSGIPSNDPCKTSPKILGYKIQIFRSNDRNKADDLKEEAYKKFNDLFPELGYSKPTYRVFLGNYFTKSSASTDLARVRKIYKGAFLVQWRVWCRSAK